MFIIDPTSVSQSEIEQDLEDWLELQPDSAKWKGFFDSQVGQRITKMIAGLGALVSYNNVIGRREGFLRTARVRSSNLGIAENLGYSVYRGQNQHVTLTVTPNFTGVLNKYQIVGSIKDHDIVMLEDVAVSNGISIELPVVFGTLNSQDLAVTSDSLAVFRFTNPAVSQDCRLLLNGSEVSISDRILDLINDKFALITNALESVDVMYLNQTSAPVQYASGDTLTIEYIELKDFTYFEKDIKFNYGTYISFLVTSPFLDKETINEIKVNAPTFHETQNLIRGREDYRKNFRSLNTSINDTDGRDVSPAVVELTYVKKDTTLFTSAEKADLIDELSNNREFGVMPPTMVDPVRCLPELDITITLLAGVVGDPETSIEEIIAAKEKLLGQTLDFASLEEEIENLSFIQTARIQVAASTWDDVAGYERCQFVKPITPNGLVYEMTRIMYFTGLVEPTWPTTVGNTIIDKDIVWTCETVDFSEDLITWTNTTEKFIDNIVVPTLPNGRMYRATAYINRSYGNDEVQKINFSAVPDTGTWRLQYDSEKTTNLAYNANASDIQNALNALAGLSTIVVTGDYTSGFTVTFQGADGDRAQPQLSVSDPGTDEVQHIAFNLVPNNGTWALDFNGQTTTPLNYDANAAAVKAALEALSNIDVVTVVGDYTNGFDITFQGINAKQDVALLTQVLLANPGADEVQQISFSSIPASGTWRIHYGDEFTNDLAYNAPAVQVQSELNALEGLSGITVTGNYTSGFTVTFGGADGKKVQPLLDVNNAGRNAVQLIKFSTMPDNGTWALQHGVNLTTSLLSNASPTDIQNALNALPSLSAVVVTGDYANGFVVTYTGADGLQPQTLLTTGVQGADEVQHLAFSILPNAGYFALTFNAQTTALIPYNATSSQLKAALEALPNIDLVTITGDFTIGFDITFQGINAKTNVSQVTVATNTLKQNITNVTVTPSTLVTGSAASNTLTRLSNPVTITIEESVSGLLPGNSLGGGVTISNVATTEGLAPVSNLDRAGTPVVVTITEATKGDFPASNLKLGVTPVVITPTTLVDAIAVEPTWPTTIGETVVDGDIVWIAVKLNGTPATWAPFTNYNTADYVQPTTPVLDDDMNELMFQCIGFVGNSGLAEPAFPTTVGQQIQDGNILWTARHPQESLVTLDWKEYYLISQNIIVS